MARFVLVPGAGGAAWNWHRVVPMLEEAGHVAIAVDLPGDDPKAGLAAYVDRVVAVMEPGSVLVAHSLGGFTAPLACARVPVRMLVLVDAMIPLPGETAGAWWGNTGSIEARSAEARRAGYREKFEVATYFLHDLPAEVLAEAGAHHRIEADVVFGDPCNFDAWPDVPIHVVASRGDRFFPLEFQRRVAKERLGAELDEVDGGHLVALSNPRGLVDRLLTYLPPHEVRGAGGEK